MPNRAWKYIVMVSKSWGRAISGPVLAVVGLLLLICQISIHDSQSAALAFKISSWATLGIAAFMIFVAQYEVWKEQYDKVEEATTKPNIRGVFENLELLKNSIGHGFDLSICNHNSVTTTVHRVEVTVYLGHGESHTLRADLSPPANSIRLERGIEQIAWAKVQFSNAMFVNKLTVRLVDAFGNTYRIPYRGPSPMSITVEHAVKQRATVYAARWGVSRLRYQNVTGELRGYFEAGTEVLAANECFGDPYFRKNKYLRVKASLDEGRTKKWYTFKEGQPVIFPSVGEP